MRPWTVTLALCLAACTASTDADTDTDPASTDETSDTTTDETDPGPDTDPSPDTDDTDDTDVVVSDADGDTFTVEDGDCDDEDAAVYPGATDAWYDGVDADCAGNDDNDQDGDGFASDAHGGDDCDDENTDLNPGVTEVWYDGVDADCAGDADFDQDGDGYVSADHSGDDCDDTDEDIHPDATEVWYDGVDADCVGDDDYDQDGDGFRSDGHGGTDCDDLVSTTNPGAPEVWYDDVDADCAFDDDFDQDGDGFASDGHGGDDCDDEDEDINPDATEVWYDGVDADCSGGSDYDKDGDSFDSDDHGGDDCDDDRSAANPDAAETCNTRDDDCDGRIDLPVPASAPMWYTDDDGDGHGVSGGAVRACTQPDGTAAPSDDCNDDEDTVYGGAPELPCDGFDNDCNPATMPTAFGAYVNGNYVGNLRNALLNAPSGALVEVCEGRHNVSDVVIVSGVTVEGLGGRDGTILDAGGVGSVLRVNTTATVTISNLTLTDGSGFDDTTRVGGGGLWLGEAANVDVYDVDISDNRSGYGAGIYMSDQSTIALTRTDVHDNRGDTLLAVGPTGGGVHTGEYTQLTLVNSHIRANETTNCGGLSLGLFGIVVGDTLSTISDNTSLLAGAGVCAASGSAIQSIEVTNNHTDNGGAGITGQSFTLNDVRVANNDAGLNGGGIWASGSLLFRDVVVTNNHADIDAGGIDVFGAATVLTLEDCTITQNRADFFAADAGGVRVSQATVTSTDTVWGTGATENFPGDIAFTTDGLTCNYPGAKTFTYDDGSAVNVCP